MTKAFRALDTPAHARRASFAAIRFELLPEPLTAALIEEDLATGGRRASVAS